MRRYGSHTGSTRVHDTGSSSAVSRVGVNRHKQYREKGAGDRLHYLRDEILICVPDDFAIITFMVILATLFS